MASDLEVIEHLRDAFGTQDAHDDAPTTMPGTAINDSADGLVLVDFGSSVTGDGSQAIEVATQVEVRGGDSVLATVISGVPIVTGVTGGGDRTADEVASARSTAAIAGENAAAAHQAAKDALDAAADGDNYLSKLVQENSDAIVNVTQAIEDERSERENYIRFGTTEDGRPTMEMGASDATARMRLTNERLAFLDGDEVVASIDGQALHIGTAYVGQSLTMGGFAWVPRGAGDLALKWVGTNGN